MPILDANTLEFFSRSAEQTRRIGMRIGGILSTGDVVALEGDLGAGKTTMTQGIAAGWGSTDLVTSPTFVLVNLYRGGEGRQLAHLDAYRIADGVTEAELLDLDQLLSNGPMIVEWAPRISGALPQERLTVRLEYMEEEHRQIYVSAAGQHYEKMLTKLRDEIFGA